MISLSAGYNKNIMFGALVPINDYKGPLLKLTASEEKKIAELQQSISNIECELYKLYQIFKRKDLSNSERYFYNNRIYSLELNKETLVEEIRQIKQTRLSLQKARV